VRANGFSAMADEYDALAETHPVVIWLRSRIRQLVERRLPAGRSLLEINAGSGLDAAHFAAKGYRVHATDIAPGMLEALEGKANAPACEGRLTWERLSFTDLDRLQHGPFDLVFSNLGGLNCERDLRSVAEHLPNLLRPGGETVLVVMPPVCPWELATALKGNRRLAFRRLSRRGTIANVGGASVPVCYHPPRRLARALGPGFETVSVRSFCLFSPPSYFDGFVGRHPTATRRLQAIDDRLGATWPFRLAGDFYALTSRLRG
jgi:SAM-dependent methyltransferase